MEFRQVRYFLEIIDQGSFQRAAESLGLTQPALSSQIALLEREFGESLLERGPRVVKLTYKGEIFRTYAERMREVWRECEEGMQSFEKEIRGKFSISAGGTVSAWILPIIIKQILKDHPHLSLSVIEGDAGETKDLMMNGKVDIGILTGKIMENNLISHEFLSDTIIPVAAKNHPIFNKKKNTIADLKEESFIVFHPASAVRRAVEQKLRSLKLNFKPHIAMELRSVESVIKSVEAGLGIGFISKYSLNENLKQIQIPELFTERKFYVCYRKNPRPSLVLLAKEILNSVSNL